MKEKNIKLNVYIHATMQLHLARLTLIGVLCLLTCPLNLCRRLATAMPPRPKIVYDFGDSSVFLHILNLLGVVLESKVISMSLNHQARGTDYKVDLWKQRKRHDA